MKFEEQIARLEEIAQKLENENTTLEESVILYEEGVKVAKACMTLLSENRNKIKALSQEMDTLFLQGEDDD